MFGDRTSPACWWQYLHRRAYEAFATRIRQESYIIQNLEEHSAEAAYFNTLHTKSPSLTFLLKYKKAMHFISHNLFCIQCISEKITNGKINPHHFSIPIRHSLMSSSLMAFLRIRRFRAFSSYNVGKLFSAIAIAMFTALPSSPHTLYSTVLQSFH